MPILYGRFFALEVDSYREMEDRIARAFAKNSLEYAFLTGRFRSAIKTGAGWPFFEDGGALVEMRPTLRFFMREANSQLFA